MPRLERRIQHVLELITALEMSLQSLSLLRERFDTALTGTDPNVNVNKLNLLHTEFGKSPAVCGVIFRVCNYVSRFFNCYIDTPNNLHQDTTALTEVTTRISSLAALVAAEWVPHMTEAVNVPDGTDVLDVMKLVSAYARELILDDLPCGLAEVARDILELEAGVANLRDWRRLSH